MFSAVPNGIVDDWVISIFVCLICLWSIFRIFENVLTEKFAFSEPILLLPLVGIILLASVQLFSSETPWLFSDRIGTVDQYETRKFILTFGALVLTAEILFRYTTTRRRLQHLVYLVLLIGVGSALFGLVRQFAPLENNALVESVIGQNASYAQFINRNHFAFLMEMTLGLLIGLLLKAKLSQGVKLLGWIMVGVVCFTTISANSRGAILSLAGLGVFAVFLHFITRKGKYSDGLNFKTDDTGFLSNKLKKALSAVALSAIFLGFSAFTVAFVGGDPVVSRIETIRGEVQENEEKVQRIKIWRSTLELIKKNPIAGVGFGGYGVAITRFDDSIGESSLQQAHNDYLEVLASGGIIAFSLLILFIGLVIYRIREPFNSGSSFRRAACFGATVGILGVMIHSVIDFGLHTIVNALVLIVLIVIATARIKYTEKIELRNKN